MQTQNNQEEIKLLTFQPKQMQEEIVKLKEQVQSLTIERNILNMIVRDLEIEISKLKTKIPKSIKELLQDLILRCLGGHWEEVKNEDI